MVEEGEAVAVVVAALGGGVVTVVPEEVVLEPVVGEEGRAVGGLEVVEVGVTAARSTAVPPSVVPSARLPLPSVCLLFQ